MLYMCLFLILFFWVSIVIYAIAPLFKYLKRKIHGKTTKAYRLDNNHTGSFKSSPHTAAVSHGGNAPTPTVQNYYNQFPQLKASIRELSQFAWSTEQAFCDPNFCLNPKVMTRMTDPEEILDIFLCHARRIAPGFAVPHMVPRVFVEPIQQFWAGAFTVEPEGWVKISISTDFMRDKLVAQAILAHEICHYILGNSGIRKPNTEQNERYTDLCMFVLGFGNVFLEGYKREAAQYKYRPGHQLGYLTDTEYECAQQYVRQLRQTNEITPPSELINLKERLNQLTRDQDVSDWLIETAQTKFPDKSELELFRYAVEREEWERRRRYL
jgi:hypothetical protein